MTSCTSVKTTCPYCGVGCGVEATRLPDGAIRIAGDTSHPANLGRLCVKGSALGDTVGLDQRLLNPQVRQGGEGGALARVSWDAALDKVAGPMDARRLDAEQASLGYTFADVGAELAKRWKFPAAFSETILAFPEPHHNGELNRLAAVVSLAAWRARVEQAQLSDDEIAACYPADLAEELGLDDNALIDDMPPPDELSAGLEELVK